MKHPEQFPATLPDRHFPMGDIDDPQLKKVAEAWFTRATAYDADQFEQYIELTSKPRPVHGEAGARTHKAALNLCNGEHGWDYRRGDVVQCVQWGYLIARAFLSETHLLPACNIDLTQEIEQMDKGDSVARARLFGQSAWMGMERSYPKLYAQFKRLLEFSRKIYSLHLDDGERYFIAGMMLPYMFSYVTCIEDYVARNGHTGLETAP